MIFLLIPNGPLRGALVAFIVGGLGTLLGTSRPKWDPPLSRIDDGFMRGNTVLALGFLVIGVGLLIAVGVVAAVD